MYSVIILPAARQDIADSAHWYNNQEKGLGKKFTAHVREIIGRIRRNPEAFPQRYNSTRTAVLADFPFMLHYRVDANTQQIIVAAVLHTSRNPDTWDERSEAV